MATKTHLKEILKKNWKILGLILVAILLLIIMFPMIQRTAEDVKCELKGGRWTLSGFSYCCEVQTLDGGKACTDNSQCESKECFALNQSQRWSNEEELNELKNRPTTGLCGNWTGCFHCSGALLVSNGRIQPTPIC